MPTIALVAVMDNHHGIAGGTTSNQSIPPLKMVADLTTTIRAIKGNSSVLLMETMALVPGPSALALTGSMISGSIAVLELHAVPRTMEIGVAIVVTSVRTNSVHHTVRQARVEVINGETARVLIGGPAILKEPTGHRVILKDAHVNSSEIIGRRAILTASPEISHEMVSVRSTMLHVAIAHNTLLSSVIRTIHAGKADRQHGKIGLFRSNRYITMENRRVHCSRGTMSALIHL